MVNDINLEAQSQDSQSNQSSKAQTNENLETRTKTSWLGCFVSSAISSLFVVGISALCFSKGYAVGMSEGYARGVQDSTNQPNKLPAYIAMATSEDPNKTVEYEIRRPVSTDGDKGPVAYLIPTTTTTYPVILFDIVKFDLDGNLIGFEITQSLGQSGAYNPQVQTPNGLSSKDLVGNLLGDETSYNSGAQSIVPESERSTQIVGLNGTSVLPQPDETLYSSGNDASARRTLNGSFRTDFQPVFRMRE